MSNSSRNIINFEKNKTINNFSTANNSTFLTPKTLKKPSSRYVPDIFELTIPDNLLDALTRTAPNFFSAYKAKFVGKIIQKRKVVGLASPGKNKTLKGDKAMPKKQRKLTKLREEFWLGPTKSEGRTPQFYYDWWCEKIEKYGIESQNWNFSWDEICINLFNQLTHLSNSYNKYPILEELEDLELAKLTEWLKSLEELYISTRPSQNMPMPNYILLMKSFNTYAELYELRKYQKSKCLYTEYFFDILDKIKTTPIILLPLSNQPSLDTTCAMYGVPIIQFESVFNFVHDMRFTPCYQIYHDIYFHSKFYIESLLKLNYSELEFIYNEFQIRTFIISEIISNKLSKIFFDDIHESNKILSYKLVKKYDISWIQKYLISKQKLDEYKIRNKTEFDELYSQDKEYIDYVYQVAEIIERVSAENEMISQIQIKHK